MGLHVWTCETWYGMEVWVVPFGVVVRAAALQLYGACRCTIVE